MSNFKKILLCIVSLLLPTIAFSEPEVWITSNNSKIFYSKEKFQLTKINPKVKVFKLYYQVIQKTPQKDLSKIFNFLKENNIKVAVEIPALSWNANPRGYATEGFSPSFFQDDLISRITSAGGNIDYFSIDEIIWYGHYNKKINLSIEDVAKQSAFNIDKYHSAFPTAKIGLIEPISQIYSMDKFNGLKDFIAIFNQHSKYKLSFIHYDMLWTDNYKFKYQQFINFAKQENLSTGVIFNDNSSSSDSKWMASARSHILSFLKNGNELPDSLIYQSWNKSPNMNFYDNDNSLGSLPSFMKHNITELGAKHVY